ncbi:MAG: hypothetical protein GX451_01170 [Acholeplasmataceae bacterium]|nr:hypothetical protein [Acholeplasmataceae bacterium]
MKLQELKERVDQALQSERNKNLEVCIPNNKGGMGGISATGVKYAGQGIDWDGGKFFVWPEKEMQEIKQRAYTEDFDTVKEAYRHAYKQLEAINIIMWESYMIKDRDFGRKQGEQIMQILDQWASKH